MKNFQPRVIISPRFCQLISIFITVYAITLYPFIIARDRLSITTYNHEKIHLVQQRELWVVGFYILYVWYWLKGKWSGIKSRDAYTAIPFEVEAYSHEAELNYIQKRRQPQAWKHCINYLT